MMQVRIVEDVEKYIKEESKELNKALKGGKIEPKESELILTPKDFRSVFSPQRLILLKAIKNNKVKSIYELAKILKRPYEAVYRDIKYLEGFGLIKIKKKKNSKIPELVDNKIEVPALV